MDEHRVPQPIDRMELPRGIDEEAEIHEDLG